QPVIKGCLTAALLCSVDPLQAQTPRFARANLVGCAKAVDTLGVTLRAPMQTHCLVLAIAGCEAPDSGPAARCFRDLEGAVQRYAAQLEPLLEMDVPRDATDTLCTVRHSSATNRARCSLVAEFGHLRDLLNAAQAAGVDLP
ncbi:MAG: hypothetical protein AB3N09_00365, partial [Tateyamaria sp.]